MDPKTRGSFPAIVSLNNPWELRAFGVTQLAPAAPPAAGAGPVAGHTLCARLYIGGVWIRQPKELHMKRLLGLLLVMVHQ